MVALNFQRICIKCPPKCQVDFLGPIFTRVAMRDLRFLDPRDQRGASAFGRGCTGEAEEESPEWGRVARQRVAEALARRWESMGNSPEQHGRF